MIETQKNLSPRDLEPLFPDFWRLSGEKLRSIAGSFDFDRGSPVFTAAGSYATRGWTDWTMGFFYGSALLQHEAVRDREFLDLALQGILEKMPARVTHMGVHDHGFNIVSTYGNLRRMLRNGILPADEWQLRYCEMALRCSAAVQAARWTPIGRLGYIYSFNGPHSLFIDTIRTLRSLALGWTLGHALLGEDDQRISLLERLVSHARMTALYSVFYGEGRDIYDVRGRVAHECIFNTRDETYRCAGSQQGYSGHSTWTRGLAWAVTGFSEILEFLETVPEQDLADSGEKEAIEILLLQAALATGDFYISQTPPDGIPYWDTGAPGLRYLEDHLERPADPFNRFEPVDSSAAAIAAQGLLRLGRLVKRKGMAGLSEKYRQAGLRIASTLLREPYLSVSADHQGLILHSVYHRPNNWDYIPAGAEVPCGESSMWGDYHARELVLYLEHMLRNSSLAFWGEEDYE